MDNKTYTNQQHSNSNEIEAIKNSVRLSDVVRTYGVNLKRHGRDLVGLCPFHNETTPSFFVYDDTKRYYCYGCKAQGDVFEFFAQHGVKFKQAFEYLGGRFVSPLKNYNLPAIAPKQKKTVDIESYDKIPTFDLKYIYNSKRDAFNEVNPDKIYTYHDEDGNPVGYMMRLVNKEGKKTFLQVALQEHPTHGLVWAFGGFATPKPLYNLPELVGNPDKPVLVVEGEKCAEAAKAILKDFVVTTWNGGSNAVDKTDWRILAKREVFIWPDNDRGGKEAAEKIAEDLYYAEVIKPKKEWAKKWDIADEIEKGAKERELTDFILSFRVPGKIPEPVKTNYKMPPGLLGDLAQYIYDASPQPHVILAIGSALSIMSILQAQKCMTEDRINPNLYIITLASSGIGKDFPLQLITTILNAIGCGHLVGNKPASSAGLISALHRRKGRLLCAIDEFGEEFKKIMCSDAGGYLRDIVTKMLTLFSRSIGEYKEEEYSDRDKPRELRVINKPHLTVYGTSTPKNFYEAVNAEDAVNGFLARLLVLQCTDVHVAFRKSSELLMDIPQELKESLQNWSYDPVNIWGSESADHYDFAPLKIPFDVAARKILHQFRDEVTQIAIDADAKGEKFKESVYRRSFEIASKLALLARSNSEYIDKEAVIWAISIVKEATEMYHKEALNHMNDGYFAKKSNEVEKYVKDRAGWVSMSDLYNRFRIKTNSMKEILDYLKQADRIEIKSVKSSDNPKNTKKVSLYRYNFNRT